MLLHCLFSVFSTLGDLFPLVDFGRFLVKKRIALLTERKQICARDTGFLDLGEDPLADVGGSLELGQGIRIRKRIVLPSSANHRGECDWGEIRLIPSIRPFSAFSLLGGGVQTSKKGGGEKGIGGVGGSVM
jgi:hypothetical protein